MPGEVVRPVNAARSGWAPQHLSFADPAGRVVGLKE